MQTYRIKRRASIVIDTRGKGDGGAWLRHGVVAVGVGVQVVRHYCDRLVLKSARIVERLEIQLT
jgi:hypothetical protein